MGHGVSTLSDSQKACIAKEMREKYDSLDPSDKDAQVNLMKHYEEIMTKFQKNEDHSPLPTGKKKRMRRNRSFDNAKFLHSQSSQSSTKSDDDAEQDSWESVRTQPSCIICKMVFTSPSRMDTHYKYSEVHRQNLLALKAKESTANGDENQKDEEKVDQHEKPELPNLRCQELYHGSKFFWRVQETIDFSIYLHFESNTVEVIAYDYHSQVEYNRLYFDENILHEIAGPEDITKRAKEYHAEMEQIGREGLKYENVLADERRKTVASLLMSKLQLIVNDKEANTKIIEFHGNLVEGQKSPVLDHKPESVIPVLVRRRRLSSSQEIAAALNDASDMEAKINVKLQEAEHLEHMAHVES